MFGASKSLIVAQEALVLMHLTKLQMQKSFTWVCLRIGHPPSSTEILYVCIYTYIPNNNDDNNNDDNDNNR